METLEGRAVAAASAASAAPRVTEGMAQTWPEPEATGGTEETVGTVDRVGTVATEETAGMLTAGPFSVPSQYHTAVIRSLRTARSEVLLGQREGL